MNQFSLNGIYLLFELNDVYVEKYYNKYKCSFQIYSHKEVFDQLNKILKRRIDVQIRLLDHQVTLCRVNVRKFDGEPRCLLLCRGKIRAHLTFL
jgi:hypothetical protein